MSKVSIIGAYNTKFGSLIDVKDMISFKKKTDQKSFYDLIIEADFEHGLDVMRLRILAESLAEERAELLALLGAPAQVGSLLADAIRVERVGVVEPGLGAEVRTKPFRFLEYRVGHRLELAAHAEA